MDGTQKFPPVYCISLARAAGRRAAMRRRLDALKLDYEMFDGVDGQALTPEDTVGRLDKEYWRRLRGRDLTAGEIGCFMSHYAVWETTVRRNLETAVVLEDDCVFSPDFAEAVFGILTAEWKWDIVLLSARKQYAVNRTLCEIGGGRRLVRFRRRVGTARSYLITNAAARRLLDYCQKIRAPVDWLYAEWWLNGLRFYAVLPAATVQDNVPSVIGKPPRLPRTPGEYLWAKKESVVSFARRQIALRAAPEKINE